MITRAKLNFSAVKNFELSVSTLTDYSAKFSRGISCLEKLSRQLAESANKLRDNVGNMASAQESLDAKIKSIEEILARLAAKLNQLEEKLSDLENQLASISSTKTVTDIVGESREISNPAYDVVSERISALEMEIDKVNTEMYSHQIRLDHANSVNSRLLSHIDAVNGVIYSLEEKKNTCTRLRTELEEIQRQNLVRGSAAFDALKKIEDLILNYLRIKMTYEIITPSESELSGQQSSININININKSTSIQGQTVIIKEEKRWPEFSAEEVKKHKIRFDDAGRIASYDGKTFGGKYNPYDTRLKRTPVDDNPILGRYEGIRGESKYIPSRRSVEGVIVTDILLRYGLDGIYYRNAEPDFEPCSEATVKISAMTENRENFTNADGEIVFGNFSQADIELAKAWNREKTEGRSDWQAEEVFDYRKANNLTWHEKCDTETMVLVPSAVNFYFKHSGGCAECRVRDGAGYDGGGFDE